MATRSSFTPKQCVAGLSSKITSSRISRVAARRGMNIVAMARVESEILEAGFKAPDFTLPDTAANMAPVNLYDYTKDAKATLIMIICNHCPFVVHLKPTIVDLAKEYQAKGVKFIAISPNNAEVTPKDAPEKMAEDAIAQGYTFP
jgi:thiol-disulfide isomerase/thioredoxin